MVSDSPDDASPAGRSGKENQAEPVEQTNQAEPSETSGRDGGKSVAGRVGQPCRYSTEEEHLVAFLENGREGGKGGGSRYEPNLFRTYSLKKRQEQKKERLAEVQHMQRVRQLLGRY